MSDPRYVDGDVVWCKCASLFWPGQVRGLDSLPQEIREGFLRMPLVVVKFFDEDGYEFVENDNNIFPYNCEKKIQFIQKGLARFRTKAKEGATDGWFAKFPKDVVHCETVTGGNPNILEEEPFVEKKTLKVDYAKIFADPAELEKKAEKKAKKGAKATPSKTPAKTPDPKGKVSSSTTKAKGKAGTSEKQTPPPRKITHPRFLKGSDHEVRILTQPTTPYHVETEKNSLSKSSTPNYRCPLCDFAASRINVIVMHSKTHSSSKVSYARKPEDSISKSEVVRKTEKPKQARDSPVGTTKKKEFAAKKRERTVTKADKKANPTSPKKPRLTKKEREEKKELQKKREEDKNKLLFDWSEDENEEAEEYKKIQESINQSLRTEASDNEDNMFDNDHSYSFADSDDEMPLLNNSRLLKISKEEGKDPASSTKICDPLDSLQSSRVSSVSPEKEKKEITPVPKDSDSEPEPQEPRPSSDNSPIEVAKEPAESTSYSGESRTVPLKDDVQVPTDRQGSTSPTRAEEATESSCMLTPARKVQQSSELKDEFELNDSVDDLLESSPEKSVDTKKIVTDMFDIDQALEETSVPDLPSFPKKFRDFHNKRRELSKSKIAEKIKRLAESSTDEETAAASDPEKASTGAPPATTASPAPTSSLSESKRGSDNSAESDEVVFVSSPPRRPNSIQLPTRPDDDAKLIRNDSPSKGVKFASLSAKIKAKQLARAQKSPENKAKVAMDGVGINTSVTKGETTKSVKAAEATAPAAGTVPAVAAAQPAESAKNGEEEDGQIYYMYVEDGQLDNQIIFDEGQLAAAGGQNVVLQGGVEGGLVMEGESGQYLLQPATGGGRTVILQDASSGQLLNVVVADEKDLRSPVCSADTSGGVATLPTLPSSSLHTQVPLITTPSGQQPIMAPSTQQANKWGEK